LTNTGILFPDLGQFEIGAIGIFIILWWQLIEIIDYCFFVWFRVDLSTGQVAVDAIFDETKVVDLRVV
jgi:hypothetical protein